MRLLEDPNEVTRLEVLEAVAEIAEVAVPIIPNVIDLLATWLDVDRRRGTYQDVRVPIAAILGILMPIGADWFLMLVNEQTKLDGNGRVVEPGD